MSDAERPNEAGLRLLTDTEGRATKMRLLAVVGLLQRDYALLAEPGESEEPEVVVYSYRNDGGEERFDEISDDAVYERVVAHCDRWLDLFGDAHGHLLALALEAYNEGRTSEAREALSVAEGLRTPLASRVTVAKLGLLQGSVALRRGAYREAQRAFVRALREAKTAEESAVELEARAGVVETLARRGRVKAARAALGRAQARAKKLRAEPRAGALDYAKGCVDLYDKGSFEAGTHSDGPAQGERALLARVLEAAVRADTPGSEGADPHEVMGDATRALFERGHKRAAVDGVLLHGQAYYAQGQFAAAGGAFVAAGERAKEAGDAWGEATALRWQAWCHLRLASPLRASKLFIEADRRARALDDYGAMARCALGLAWTLANEGAHREALDLLKPAVEWLRAAGDGLGRVEVYRARAELWARLGNAKNAKRAEKKAAKLTALAGESPAPVAVPEVWPALG